MENNAASELRQVLDVLQERIDNPNSTFYITSDLKVCWNTISSVVTDLDSDSNLRENDRKRIEELTEALKELHENTLYQLGEQDDRPDRAPYQLFDKVEKALNPLSHE